MQVGKDGRLDPGRSTESLEMNTPWIAESLYGKISDHAITSLKDNRLPLIAQAAEQGYHLAGNALGQGWEVAREGAKQTFSTYGQDIVLDTADHSFGISAEGSFMRGDNDYDVKSAVKFKDGNFQRV